MSINEVRDFPPVFGFENANSHYYQDPIDRWKFNGFRITGYIPVIASIGILIKPFVLTTGSQILVREGNALKKETSILNQEEVEFCKRTGEVFLSVNTANMFMQDRTETLQAELNQQRIVLETQANHPSITSDEKKLKLQELELQELELQELDQQNSSCLNATLNLQAESDKFAERVNAFAQRCEAFKRMVGYSEQHLTRELIECCGLGAIFIPFDLYYTIGVAALYSLYRNNCAWIKQVAFLTSFKSVFTFSHLIWLRCEKVNYLLEVMYIN